MKNRYLVAIALLGASALSGCGTIGDALGVSQKTQEATYVDGALLADAGIISGKETPNQVGDTCLVDGVNYASIINGRSSADTFSYVPADNAHVKLQDDGAPISPLQCRKPGT